MPDAADGAQRRPTTPACSAPWTALYLRPDGQVAACCGSWHLLGRVSGPDRRSLREIWQGAMLAQQRAALAEHDYTLGCWECGRHVEAGDRASSLAADFDRWVPSGEASHPLVLDLALSNRCNLQCVMCNGGLSSAIRRHREHRDPLPSAYDDRFFAELDELLPHLRRLQFKGGEPFLARENRRIWDRLIEWGLRPEVAVTTNGTIWNAKVAHYVEELAMEVTVSVDAVDPDVLAAVRVGTHAEVLWANIERFREVTERTGARLTLAMCLMSTTWQELGGFLAEVDRLEAQADIIWVDGPSRYDLRTQPPEVLAEVAAALEAESPSRTGLRPDLRAIWDEAVERIGSLAADGARRMAAEATPVSIGSNRQTGQRQEAGQRQAAGRRWEDDVQRWRQELARTSSESELLELVYENDVIERTEVPAWAEFLDPASWEGRGLDETMAVISMAAGVAVRSKVESLESGVHRAELKLGDDPGGPVLDACLVPGPVGSGLSRLLIALKEPAAAGQVPAR